MLLGIFHKVERLGYIILQDLRALFLVWTFYTQDFFFLFKHMVYNT